LNGWNSFLDLLSKKSIFESGPEPYPWIGPQPPKETKRREEILVPPIQAHKSPVTARSRP
jgi:hypothetical protein